MTLGELVYTVHHCILSCDQYSYQNTIHQLNNNGVTYDYPNISITSAHHHIYDEIPDTHNGRNTPPIYSTVIEDETRPAHQYITTAENPAYHSTMAEVSTPGGYITAAVNPLYRIMAEAEAETSSEYSTTAVNPLYRSTYIMEAPAPAEYSTNTRERWQED